MAATTGAGFRHVVLIVPSPYPTHVPRWVTDEIITPSSGDQDRLD